MFNNVGFHSHNNSLSFDITSLTNIQSLGQFLYTEGYIYFLVSSIVLLVAMVGAIVMTLYHEQEVRRQDIFSQITTDIKLTSLNKINSNFLSNSHIIPDFKLRN
jgi:hypothetical protein